MNEKGDGLTKRSSLFMAPPVKARALRSMIYLLSMGKKGLIEGFRYHFTLTDYFRNLMIDDPKFEILDTKNKFPLILFKLKH